MKLQFMALIFILIAILNSCTKNTSESTQVQSLSSQSPAPVTNEENSNNDNYNPVENTDQIIQAPNISKYPELLSQLNTVSFEFTINTYEKNSIFKCKLNNNSFEECTSPIDLKNINEGLNKFQVIHVLNNLESSPTIFEWVKDSIPPNIINFQIGSSEVSKISESKLNISATDASEIKVFTNNSCMGESEWKPFASSINITLTQANSLNYFSILLKDKAGNITKCQSDSIEYIPTIPPQITIDFPTTNSSLNTNRNSILIEGSCSTNTQTLTANLGQFIDNNCSDQKWQLSIKQLNIGQQQITITATNEDQSNSISLNVNKASNATDPLFSNAWHIKNIGQNNYAYASALSGIDHNVLPVHELGVTGKNIIIAISDTGLETQHEDLKDNMYREHKNYTMTGWYNKNPENTIDKQGDHGTSVAGICSAVKNNKKGSFGIAPDSYLKGIRIIAENQSNTWFIDQYQTEAHIINQSWGRAPRLNNDKSVSNYQLQIDSQNEYNLLNEQLDTLKENTLGTLNNKLKAIFIKSAGNFESYGLGVAYDIRNTSPYSIIVAAANSNGLRSSYSSVGPEIWISGFGGEFGRSKSSYTFENKTYYVYTEPAILTTDQSGCENGYSGSIFSTNYSKYPNYSTYNVFNKFDLTNNTNHSENSNCNYSADFNGTSAAAPNISGIVALLLEANPNLNWRGIKDILARTAQIFNPTSSNWITNAAGFKYNRYMGFGIANAKAAVDLAKNYNNNWSQSDYITSELSIDYSNNLQSIPDQSPAGLTIPLNINSDLVVESVQIIANINHTRNGDLKFYLKSPSKTESILWDSTGLKNSQNLLNFTMLSNAFYGENSIGQWELKIVDSALQNLGALKNIKIIIYGHNK